MTFEMILIKILKMRKILSTDNFGENLYWNMEKVWILKKINVWGYWKGVGE